ncbi:MAG TPA: enoyl-CoA hydratase [Steroidobacteraceae bacterium]
MSGQILMSRADGVCELRFNRPEKRNAITFAMYEALYAGLREAQADAGVRVVLLGGEGAGFCAGNDLNDFLNGPQFSSEHPVMGFLHTLATFEKPLLAAIHGQTVGIGVTLLLHCDLVIAARSAQLSMPFVTLGLVPEAASSLLLPRLVGQQRAAELLFLGKPFDAATAHSLGLVNRVVEEDALLPEARALARAVAQQPNGALLATRRLLRADPEQIRARIDAEARIFGAQLQSEEFRAAVRAFLGKGRAG